MPGQAQGMLEIEKLFYDFTSKIPEIKEENYWKRIQILKMYSQERRMERYRIIYVWKIIEGHVPNCGIDLAQENARLGRKCQIPKLKPNGRRAIQTLREHSLQINGARLFNCKPKKLRESKFCQEEFKYELDQ